MASMTQNNQKIPTDTNSSLKYVECIWILFGVRS